MKPLVLLGIVLIVLGSVTLVYEGITYTRSRTVVDIGPFEAKLEEKRTIPVPPVLALAALVGGAALIMAGSRTAGTA